MKVQTWKRFRQWRSEWVSEREGVFRAAKTKPKPRQRRSWCADKDKSKGAIPKPPNYCHIKLKAFPKMFNLEFCFAKFGASSITKSQFIVISVWDHAKSLFYSVTYECKIAKMSGKLVICKRAQKRRKTRAIKGRLGDWQLAIIGRRVVKFKFGDIGR